MGWLANLLPSRASRLTLDEATWQLAMALPLFAGLTDDDRRRLKDLAAELLADKRFNGASELDLGADRVTAIAAQAVLPILNLGYGWYQGWNEVIVYPGEFVPEREVMDEFGVMHHVRQPMSGEAWEGGPLVLSWQDVAWSGLGEGYSVVIHEFAHKLDMKNGQVDGQPPMPRGMAVAEWSAAFQTAYDDFCRRVDGGERTTIDPYAAQSPAEFFAVLSEYFFDLPAALRQEYPAVYEQLRRFYQQDPLHRQERMA